MRAELQLIENRKRKKKQEEQKRRASKNTEGGAFVKTGNKNVGILGDIWGIFGGRGLVWRDVY